MTTVKCLEFSIEVLEAKSCQKDHLMIAGPWQISGCWSLGEVFNEGFAL